LPYDNTNVLNVRAYTYNNASDYSPIVDLSYAISGTYEDFVYTAEDETYTAFSSLDYPVKLTLPYNKNATNGWDCVYYNEDTLEWESNGCTVMEIMDGYVEIAVSHFSMFKLTEINDSTPPPKEFNPSNNCDENLSPIYILVVSLFLAMILLPVMIVADKYKSTQVSKTTVKQPAPPSTPRVSPKNTVRHLMKDSEEEGGAAEEEFKEDAVEEVGDLDADLTEKSYAEENNQNVTQIETVQKVVKIKSEFVLLLEGHLTFGLFFYRNQFSRWLRLFTLLTVVVFELLLEGLLYYGFESYNSGREKSTQASFDDYKGLYLGYTVLAVAIAIPVEIYMIICLAMDRAKAPVLAASAVAMGAVVIMGSIVGVVMLSVDFCHQWSGYWSVSFLWGILIEVFVMQTFYMLVRYLILLCLPQDKTEAKKV